MHACTIGRQPCVPVYTWGNKAGYVVALLVVTSTLAVFDWDWDIAIGLGICVGVCSHINTGVAVGNSDIHCLPAWIRPQTASFRPLVRQQVHHDATAPFTARSEQASHLH